MIGAQEYRFLVVHSSKLDDRKARALEKKLALRSSALERKIKDKLKETYACAPDAEMALRQFRQEHADEYFPLTGRIIAKEKRKPGRPCQNGSATEGLRLADRGKT